MNIQYIILKLIVLEYFKIMSLWKKKMNSLLYWKGTNGFIFEYKYNINFLNFDFVYKHILLKYNCEWNT